MWGTEEIGESNNEIGSGIKSGYDVSKTDGLAKLKSDFVEALTLNSTDANEATILKFAQKSGQMRAFNELLKRTSKQKLETGRAALQISSTVYNHANTAAKTELAFQQNTARGLESLSLTNLDLDTEQHKHGGFNTYISDAKALINF